METDNITSSASDINSTVSCYEMYETVDYKVQAALRAAVGFTSFICCASVVFIIVLFKKYKFYTQRLILYLSIVTMIHAFSYTITRVNYYTARPIEDHYCYFSGLLNHYSAFMGLLSILIITFNLLTKILCNCSTVKAEPVFVLIIFFLPMLWLWVPIWLKAYGTVGGWCSIRSLNVDCTPYADRSWLRFGLWYIPLYTLMFIIVICMILAAITVARESRRWIGKWDPETIVRSQTIKKEIITLLWYPLIFLLLNTFSLINQIYDAINPMNPSAVLIYLRIFTSTARGAFIALAYGLDRDTRNRLRSVQCKAACVEWVGGHKMVKDFTIRSSSFQESGGPYQNMDEGKWNSIMS